jgi:RNA polymerase sigma-70 factor (ECF subfamily)
MVLRRCRQLLKDEDKALDAMQETFVRLLLDQLFGGERESTRAMATLHYVDGLTLEETAAQVGLSVSGVRKRLRGLRAKGLALEEG